MKIFLAGNIGRDCPQQFLDFGAPYVLQTFWDLKGQPDKRVREIKQSTKEFLLDSGAFTMIQQGGKVDFEKYADEYADYVKRNKIEHFFKIDIDPIIGIERTMKLTNKIEKSVGRQSIPVFHKGRGVAWWRKACQEYQRVAIGASGLNEDCKWVKNQAILQELVNIAHSYGTKVHGLGYTRTKNINETIIPFDSVDSSACLSGGRFAAVYKFANGKLLHASIKGRVKDYKKLNDHNILEWIKMARYKDEQDKEDV